MSNVCHGSVFNFTEMMCIDVSKKRENSWLPFLLNVMDGTGTDLCDLHKRKGL